MLPLGVIFSPPMVCPAQSRFACPSISFVALCVVAVLLAGLCAFPCSAQEGGFNGSIDAPEAEVLKAVDLIVNDTVVHGTYSYEKEKELKGAKSASSVRVFGDAPDGVKVFFKVLENVLAPRHFKETADLGTIYVRYFVQGTSPATTAIHVDAVYIEKNRRRQHPSDGTVEQSEFQAIKDRLEKMQSDARAIDEMATQSSLDAPPQHERHAVATPAQSASLSSSGELEKRVADLRHRVEMRTAAGGAALKAAPYRTAATLEPLPAKTDVLIVVLTRYWYGVETTDGHHGWIHRSQVEPLP